MTGTSYSLAASEPWVALSLGKSDPSGPVAHGFAPSLFRATSISRGQNNALAPKSTPMKCVVGQEDMPNDYM